MLHTTASSQPHPLPDRALDMAIAEHVEGWRRTPQPPDSDGHWASAPLLLPPDVPALPDRRAGAWTLPRRGPVPMDHFVPAYSRDVFATFALLRRLEARAAHDPVRRRFHTLMGPPQIHPDTASWMHRVCHAALAAATP